MARGLAPGVHFQGEWFGLAPAGGGGCRGLGLGLGLGLRHGRGTCFGGLRCVLENTPYAPARAGFFGDKRREEGPDAGEEGGVPGVGVGFCVCVAGMAAVVIVGLRCVCSDWDADAEEPVPAFELVEGPSLAGGFVDSGRVEAVGEELEGRGDVC